MRLFLSIALSLLIFSCKKENGGIMPGARELLDVRYAQHKDNTMDIYLPEKRNGNTRTLVLIHGGYWYSGNKSELTGYAKYFRDQGFAVVNMNYKLTRTADNNVHPAQVNDIAKAIEYISSRSRGFNIAADKFGLMGVSAGGHLALLYTYSSNSNGKVRSVAAVAAPSNFTNSGDATPGLVQVVSWLIGAGPDLKPGAYVQISPITHVSASARPTFLVHGMLDNVVPFQQSVALSNRLKSFNVKNELRLFENAGHDFKDAGTVSTILSESAAWFQATIN